MFISPASTMGNRMPPNTPSLGVGVASEFDSLDKYNGVGRPDASINHTAESSKQCNTAVDHRSGCETLVHSGFSGLRCRTSIQLRTRERGAIVAKVASIKILELRKS